MSLERVGHLVVNNCIERYNTAHVLVYYDIFCS